MVEKNCEINYVFPLRLINIEWFLKKKRSIVNWHIYITTTTKFANMLIFWKHQKK